MPPRPTLSANSFGSSDYIYPPFYKHCAIATDCLQLSTHNRLSRFLQPPCALPPLPWGVNGTPYSYHQPPKQPYHPSLGEGTGVGFPFHQPHKQPCHPSLGEGTEHIFPTTNHPNSLATPPLGRGRGWVFFSVNFLQGPWSNLTAALENYYKAPGALLQGCWRNLTDTLGKPAKAAVMHKKVHLRSAERKKRRLFYCIARAF